VAFVALLLVVSFFLSRILMDIFLFLLSWRHLHSHENCFEIIPLNHILGSN
jgi:hypothetical protein